MLPRRCIGPFAILTLCGCQTPKADPAPVPTPSAATTAPEVAMTAPTASVAASGEAEPAPSYPIVHLRLSGVEVEGKPVAPPPSPQKVAPQEDLLDAMKQWKRTWEEDHPDGAFPGEARLSVAADVNGVALKSAFYTMVYAGFPQIELEIGGERGWIRGRVPSPPCNATCEVYAEGYVLRVRAAGEGYRLMVAKEKRTITDAGRSPRKLETTLPQLVSEHDVIRIVAHIVDDETAGQFGRYLVAAARASPPLPGRTRLSLDPFEDELRTTKKLQLRRWTTGPLAGLTAEPSSGRLPPDRVQSVVLGARPRFQRCFEAGLAQDPKLAGKIVMSFRIVANGTVKGAKVTGELPLAVRECSRKVLESLTFPEPEDGPVRVSYPLVFSSDP